MRYLFTETILKFYQDFVKSDIHSKFKILCRCFLLEIDNYQGTYLFLEKIKFSFSSILNKSIIGALRHYNIIKYIILLSF